MSVGLILPQRNRLAYPCGVAPGFNPAHPAAAGMRPLWGSFSAVPYGGTFVDLLSGTVAAQTGTVPPAASLTQAGPGVVFTNATGTPVQACSFTNNNASTAGTALTLAGIVLPKGNPPNGSLGVNVSWLGACVLCLNNNTPSTTIEFLQVNISAINSTMTPFSWTSGHPQFVVFSYRNSDGLCNFVWSDLVTGAVQAEAHTGGTTGMSDSRASAGVGLHKTNQNNVYGSVLAAMGSPSFLPLSVLQAWAADPWSFWYPAAGNPGASVWNQLVSASGSTALALAALSAAMAKGQITPAFYAQMLAHSEAQAAARGTGSYKAFSYASSSAQAKSSSVLAGRAPLTGRSASQSKAQGLFANALFLTARAASMAKTKLGAPALSILLAAKSKAQAMLRGLSTRIGFVAPSRFFGYWID